MRNQFYRLMSRVPMAAALRLGLAGTVMLAGCSGDHSGATDGKQSAHEGKQARSIAIVATEDVDEAILTQTAQFVGANWQTHVRSARVKDAQKVAPGAHDACLLLLVNKADAKVDPLDSVRVADQRAELNIYALENGPWEKKYVPRMINKEAMRAVGLMLGLEPCPFFQCAMYNMLAPADHRQTSQNYCPPCAGKMEAALKRHGLESIMPTGKKQ